MFRMEERRRNDLLYISWLVTAILHLYPLNVVVVLDVRMQQTLVALGVFTSFS